jgi:hypothetical protein
MLGCYNANATSYVKQNPFTVTVLSVTTTVPEGDKLLSVLSDEAPGNYLTRSYSWIWFPDPGPGGFLLDVQLVPTPHGYVGGRPSLGRFNSDVLAVLVAGGMTDWWILGVLPDAPPGHPVQGPVADSAKDTPHAPGCLRSQVGVQDSSDWLKSVQKEAMCLELE